MKSIDEKTLTDAVKSSKSFREVARKIGINPNRIKPVLRNIKKYNISTSHFTGKSWSKGFTSFTIENIQNKRIKNSELKRILFSLKEKENKCEICGIKSWLGKNLVFEIHHKDGNRLNNNINNLMIVCPNCHSQTNNFRGRNITKKYISDDVFKKCLLNSKNIREALIKLKLSPKGANYERAKKIIEKEKILFDKTKIENKCIDCGVSISKKSKRCRKCSSKLNGLKQRHVIRPTKDILEREIKNNSFCSLGKKYCVSDNTIRKWCKKYNINIK